MKTTLHLSLMLAASIVVAEAGENQIAGKWASDSRTKGGLGTMLIFADDGAMTNIFGALVDFKYQLEGQTIKETFTDSGTGKSTQTTLRYRTVGDKLIVEAEPANTTNLPEMTRVGTAKPGEPAIVGIWTFKHYTGGMATMQFTSDGLEQLSVPMLTSSGRYSLQTNALTMEVKGQPVSTRKILLAGDHLTLLANGAEHEQKFTRVRP